jgi:hypothetical protein
MGRVCRYLGEIITHEQIVAEARFRGMHSRPMVDPFRFFGCTSMTSFAASITTVCSKSSSGSSSKSKFSNKNSAHGASREAQQPRRIMRTAAANPRRRIRGCEEVWGEYVPADGGGDSG